MITLVPALALGIIQGLAEFLPISSSAHLILAPWFFGWRDPGLAFDVALHAGTLLALLIYFFRDWLKIIRAGFFGGRGEPSLWLIVLATVPGAAAGVLLESAAETTLRSPLIIVFTLSGAGLLLLLADRVRRERPVGEFNVTAALLIGLAQAAAIVPGISRSGATITAARALGYSRAAAARLSFLLATPITAGAALFALRHLRSTDITAPFLVGVAAAALSGLAAIHFLLRYVSRGSYRPFVWYRLVLAALIAVIIIFRR